MKMASNIYVDRIVAGGVEDMVVEIHLPRLVRKFSRTEEALREGYSPFRETRSWAIGSDKWRVVREERSDIIFADLNLDSIDVPAWVEAYVPSARLWEDDSLGKQFIISAQYYRKLEPNNAELKHLIKLEELAQDMQRYITSERQRIGRIKK